MITYGRDALYAEMDYQAVTGSMGLKKEKAAWLRMHKWCRLRFGVALSLPASETQNSLSEATRVLVLHLKNVQTVNAIFHRGTTFLWPFVLLTSLYKQHLPFCS